MISKERVRTALMHKNTDKVPTTMQCVETAWDNIMKYLKADTREEVFDETTRIIKAM